MISFGSNPRWERVGAAPRCAKKKELALEFNQKITQKFLNNIKIDKNKNFYFII